MGVVRAKNFGLAPLAHTLEPPFPNPGYRPEVKGCMELMDMCTHKFTCSRLCSIVQFTYSVLVSFQSIVHYQRQCFLENSNG